MPHPKKHSPGIVIRRPVIWDSRAPFHNFLWGHKEISRDYNLMALAVHQLKHDAGQDRPDRQALRFLKKIAEHSGPASRFYQGYKLSFGGRDSQGEYKKLFVSDILRDLDYLLDDFGESAIIREASLFEAYAQCWALNFLLSKLENGTGWTTDEQQLAEEFCPLDGKRNTPPWPVITKRLPDLQSRLSKLPHINKDRLSGEDVDQPVSPGLNAHRAIKFWREFRNLIVHNSGLITAEFFNKNDGFFEQLRAPYGRLMFSLKIGEQLKIVEAVFPAMATTHHKVAKSMNEWLVTESRETRGHPQAPYPKTITSFAPVSAPPLFLEGDHPESYQYELKVRQSPSFQH